MDHYAALGVDRRASADEVSEAYGRRVAELRARQLAENDPARLTATEIELDRVEEAWRVLSDPSARTSYDVSTTFGAGGGTGAGDDPVAWQPEAGDSTTSTRTRLFLVVAAIAILGVVVTVFFAGGAERDDEGELVSSGTLQVTDLQVGDCFDSTIDETVGETVEVQGVDAIPCGEPHRNQVYAIRELPDGADAPFPGDDAAFESSGLLCLETFEDFVGLAYEESVLDISVVYPSADTWGTGDREVVCAVYDPAGPVTGSLEDAMR
ncbi:MAG: septum formation family protein [Actinobacteria bacterium]|nr:septum formation family protein [Actinomycetota bacterium]